VNIYFILAGEGPELDYCRRETEKRGLRKVILPGFVSDTEAVHNIADIQLNCSYGTETSSLSVLEGYSLGKPAVVSDFGGNPFIVNNGETGYVVPKKNAEAAADAIMSIYGSKQLYGRLSEGAFKAYREKYTAEIMAQNIERIYKEAVSNG